MSDAKAKGKLAKVTNVSSLAVGSKIVSIKIISLKTSRNYLILIPNTIFDYY